MYKMNYAMPPFHVKLIAYKLFYYFSFFRIKERVSLSYIDCDTFYTSFNKLPPKAVI